MTILTVGDNTSLTGSVNADLTGASLAVHIKRPDATVINRAGVIVGDATEGDWSFDLIDGDLTMAGMYRIEVKVTYSSGEHQDFATDRSGKEITFKVRNYYVA